jgi:hypothetical protein
MTLRYDRGQLTRPFGDLTAEEVVQVNLASVGRFEFYTIAGDTVTFSQVSEGQLVSWPAKKASVTDSVVTWNNGTPGEGDNTLKLGPQGWVHSSSGMTDRACYEWRAGIGFGTPDRMAQVNAEKAALDLSKAEAAKEAATILAKMQAETAKAWAGDEDQGPYDPIATPREIDRLQRLCDIHSLQSDCRKLAALILGRA